jgi:hypothetical protein
MHRFRRHNSCTSTAGARSRAQNPRKLPILVCSLLGCLGVAGAAQGAATLKLGDESSVTLGFGTRLSYTNTEDGAPNGSSSSNDFAVENARLFLSGQYGRYLKGTLNTERQGGPAASGGDSIRIMDAIAQFEFSDPFNLWLGRMLPPSDRANLAGPFYVLPWSYPGTVSNYPNIAVGRDDGGLVWGKLFGGKLVYSLGAFDGHNSATGLSNQSDKLLFAGRLHFNILDVEPPPAHYLGETYLGSKDIFSIGIAGNTQSDGAGTAANPGRLNIWSVDVMFEKKLAGGFVPTLVGAYYSYDLNGAVDCGSGEPGSVACPSGDNVGGQVDGKAWMATAGLLLPMKVGWGQFQPFVRYQKFERDLSNTTSKAYDFGVNYIIRGPDAKISLMYTKLDDTRLRPADTDIRRFTLGVQLLF